MTMKYIILVLASIIVLSSCRCPSCFTFPGPFRLAFYNIQEDNLLDPSLSNKLEILSFEYKNGKKVNYIIKDYVIEGYSEDVFHLEVISTQEDSFYSDCIEKETRFYLKFMNQDVDTLDVFFEEVHESRCCTEYLTHLKYNGVEITEADTIVGAAIIMK